MPQTRGDIFDQVEANPDLGAPAQQPPAQPPQGAGTAKGDIFDQVEANPNLPFQSPEDKQEATGEQTGDLGQKIIVPKPGESFTQTMQRAAAYGKTVTPQTLTAEEKTIPKKAAEVAVAAPAIGAALPAAEAGLGETLSGLVTGTTERVKALGSWAKDNPLHAYLLYQVLKDMVPGMKKAMGIVKESPMPEQ